MIKFLCCLILTFHLIFFKVFASYQPDWDSLDARPLPQWFDDAKIGIFVHWGVFSVPSFGSEWFWYDWKEEKKPEFRDFMKQNYAPKFSYQDFAPQFTAEFFDAKRWAQIFNDSGAKYVVLTSKHHEGFTLWPSKYSFNWNSMDLGPNRDIVGELAEAVRDLNLTFGVYHSLYEWFNPLYLADKTTNFTSNEFVTGKTLPELFELVQNYRPEVIWSDGDWEALDSYWDSKNFLAWLYNESPVKDTVVVNDRWGQGSYCMHGDFYNCKDRFNPEKLQNHKWENAMTLDKVSWGYRRNAPLADYLTIEEILYQIVSTVSCGGNILINVGPSKDGIIKPIFEERLKQIGGWLQVNGEAIYKSRPWRIQKDSLNGSTIWYTQRPDLNNSLYMTFFSWPKNQILNVPYFNDIYNPDTEIELFGIPGTLKWILEDENVNIYLPPKENVATNWAWTLKVSWSQ